VIVRLDIGLPRNMMNAYRNSAYLHVYSNDYRNLKRYNSKLYECVVNVNTPMYNRKGLRPYT